MDLLLFLLTFLTIIGWSMCVQEACSEAGGVRLVGGRDQSVGEGRLEICYKGTWYTVKHIVGNTRDVTTRMICSQLGYHRDDGLRVVLRQAYFGESSGPFLNSIDCNENITNLTQCTYQTDANSTDLPISVICPDNCSDAELRSVGFDAQGQPEVQICYRGIWGSVCEDPTEDIKGTEVVAVCRQLISQQGKLKESWTLVYPRTEISFFNNVVLCDDAVFELTGGTCDSELCEGWESCVYNRELCGSLSYETENITQMVNSTLWINCSCPEGYNWNGNVCQDIDECVEAELDTDNKSYVCVNGPGGHLHVSCDPGYQSINRIQCIAVEGTVYMTVSRLQSTNDVRSKAASETMSQVVTLMLPSKDTTLSHLFSSPASVQIVPNSSSPQLFITVLTPLSILIVLLITMIMATLLGIIMWRKKLNKGYQQQHNSCNPKQISDQVLCNPMYNDHEFGIAKGEENGNSVDNPLYDNPVYEEVSELPEVTLSHPKISDIDSTDGVSLDGLTIGLLPSQVESRRLLAPPSPITGRYHKCEKLELEESAPPLPNRFLDPSSSALIPVQTNHPFTAATDKVLSDHKDEPSTKPGCPGYTFPVLVIPKTSPSRRKAQNGGGAHNSHTHDMRSVDERALETSTHVYATLEPQCGYFGNSTSVLHSSTITSSDEGRVSNQPNSISELDSRTASLGDQSVKSKSPTFDALALPVIANGSSDTSLMSSAHLYATLEELPYFTPTLDHSVYGVSTSPCTPPGRVDLHSPLTTASFPSTRKRHSSMPMDDITHRIQPSFAHDYHHLPHSYDANSTSGSGDTLPSSPHLYAILEPVFTFPNTSTQCTHTPYSTSSLHIGRHSLPASPSPYLSDRQLPLPNGISTGAQPYQVPTLRANRSTNTVCNSLDGLDKPAVQDIPSTNSRSSKFGHDALDKRRQFTPYSVECQQEMGTDV